MRATLPVRSKGFAGMGLSNNGPPMGTGGRASTPANGPMARVTGGTAGFRIGYPQRPYVRQFHMILTADSTVATQANRRRTGNGWHTTFIGKNRNTLKQGETPPDANIVYPMAFLVEKD